MLIFLSFAKYCGNTRYPEPCSEDYEWLRKRIKFSQVLGRVSLRSGAQYLGIGREEEAAPGLGNSCLTPAP